MHDIKTLYSRVCAANSRRDRYSKREHRICGEAADEPEVVGESMRAWKETSTRSVLFETRKAIRLSNRAIAETRINMYAEDNYIAEYAYGFYAVACDT